MLTNIYVNGFKTLSKFKLSFNQGLNVLIGPNAAGKTNICQSIGLLSAMADDSVSDYILSIGGTNSIFRLLALKKGKNNISSKNITIKCSGITSPEYGKSRIDLKYDYFFRLALKEKIIIKKETLKIYRKIKDNQYKTVLECSNKPVLSIRIRDTKLIGPVIPYFNKYLKRKNRGKIPTPFTLKIKEPKGHKRNVSILSEFGGLFFIIHLIKDDLRKSKVFNIDPHMAKESADSIESSEMLSDGKRLSNALYYMFEKKKEDIKEINNFLRSIFPDFSKLSTEVSRHGTKRTFSVIYKNGLKFYAYSLSDGIVKTIALLVGIFGQKRSTTIIEELENYLHPWACKSLIDYFRDFFKQDVCLLTTHSETILNLIKPREIIICENKDGVTKSFRIKNIKELEKNIKSTGFGCGYHYVAGAIKGIPL